MANARQFITQFSRQRGLSSTKLPVIQPLVSVQRSSFYTTLADSEQQPQSQPQPQPQSQPQPQQPQQQRNNTNFAETLARKFLGQVRMQRQIGGGANSDHKEPSRFVRIRYLPRTVTTEDIYKLAREAFPKGDKNILDVIFERTDEFNMTGRCIVCMSSPEDARQLVEYGHQRTVGGNLIDMDYYGSKKTEIAKILNEFRRPELVSVHDAGNFSGRSVIISGFPLKTRTDNVLGYLRSRNFFPIEGSPDNVIQLKTKNQATVSKFLVKFESESEAWRCVRAFHNTDFLLGLGSTKTKFPLQLFVAY
ncbi:uncharacterized protein BX663DRAFT_504091 [Cokeromyces recurvatus]|uniref:uncharacterized protein n=1 Tax=Cokeromyces recurvatus TaxID=90255 RepID=UPI0022203ECB|nr:uncharacterized protein BX663DRAFT_504091 [Cokeromyces recurvatus]KAI7904140.1 hypothetical protein BX663DRAFT_504091 [Cokeromyces recurvatus]